MIGDRTENLNQAFADASLSYRIDNDVAAKVEISQDANTASVALVSASGKELSRQTIELNQEAARSLSAVDFDQARKRLVFSFKDGSGIYCDLFLMLSNLQEKLTAGDNITIYKGRISAKDTTYSAGDGLSLSGARLSVDESVARTEDLEAAEGRLEQKIGEKAESAGPVFTESLSMGRVGVAGAGSTALGENVIASGKASLSIGNDTEATGEGSIALGVGSSSSGKGSFAAGVGAIASKEGGAALGKYNIDDGIFTVGNGTKEKRSNALSLKETGDLTVSGDVYSKEGKLASVASIPTKTSQLANDSDFITGSEADEKIAAAAEGHATVEQLNAKQDRLTFNQIVPSGAKQSLLGSIKVGDEYFTVDQDKVNPDPKWGAIAGNLADQADLTAALSEKAPRKDAKLSGSVEVGTEEDTLTSGLTVHGTLENGVNAQATGRGAHAEGVDTVASGNYSHAEGKGTIASGEAQHVLGRYNVSASTTTVNDQEVDLLEIVGNGSSDESRSNARTLDASGNESLAGSLSSAGNVIAAGSVFAANAYVASGEEEEDRRYVSVVKTGDNVSSLTNDANYVTVDGVASAFDHVVEQDQRPTSLSDVAFSGNYGDVIGRPTKLSDLTDDLADRYVRSDAFRGRVESYLTSNEYLTKTVADDTYLLNTATTIGAALSKNKDASGWPLKTVAYTGSYSDLTDKPEIPEMPTNVSQLANDAGYLTSADIGDTVDQAIEGKGFVQSSALDGEVGALGYLKAAGVEGIIGSKGFVTSANLAQAVADSVSTAVKEATADFVTSEEATEQISDALANYYDIPTANEKISGDVATALKGYAKEDYVSTYVGNILSDSRNEGENPYTQMTDVLGAIKKNVTDKLAAVATSGEYKDLQNLPDIGAAIAGYVSGMGDEGYVTRKELNGELKEKQNKLDSKNIPQGNVTQILGFDPNGVLSFYPANAYEEGAVVSSIGGKSGDVALDSSLKLETNEGRPTLGLNSSVSLIYEGAVNGIGESSGVDLSLISGYRLLVLSGYKFGHAWPNQTTVLVDVGSLPTPEAGISTALENNTLTNEQLSNLPVTVYRCAAGAGSGTSGGANAAWAYDLWVWKTAATGTANGIMHWRTSYDYGGSHDFTVTKIWGIK